MNRDEKAATIEEIAAQIEGAEAIFAVDYRGISVPQASELRGKLHESDASFRIVKNRLTKLAAEKAGEERLAPLLQGPTALAFVQGDTAAAAKTITTFNKDHEVLIFKGGFMADTELDEDRFKSIARLPGREVLNGQFAGVVASPLTGLVRGLGSMVQGLALQLGQIAEQGLVTGEVSADEPPAAETETSAEEEPSQAEGDEGDADPAADEASDNETAEADETPADPGSEAEESAVDGEAESPSEEESQSDSSTTSEGDESSDTDKDQEEE